jgi:hypothetical protein
MRAITAGPRLTPAKREYFSWAHDEKRVELSRGRDLTLGPRQAGQPLPYGRGSLQKFRGAVRLGRSSLRRPQFADAKNQIVDIIGRLTFQQIGGHVQFHARFLGVRFDPIGTAEPLADLLAAPRRVLQVAFHDDYELITAPAANKIPGSDLIA